MKQLGNKIQEAETKLAGLKEKQALFVSSVNKLGSANNKLLQEILDGSNQRQAINNEIEVKMAQLADLEKLIKDHASTLHTAWLILTIMQSPEYLNNDDMEQLLRIMISLRRQRDGLEPREVVDSRGNIICQCLKPMPSLYVSKYTHEPEEISRTLAQYLFPQVKDEYVLKSVHQMTELSNMTLKLQTEMLELIRLLSLGQYPYAAAKKPVEPPNYRLHITRLYKKGNKLIAEQN